MRYGKLMLGTMVMASMFGLAACSDSAGGLSGTAGEDPVSTTGGADSVGEILANLKEKERIDLAMLEEACGGNRACLDDLEAFKTFLGDKCASQSGCDYQAALLLYLTRTPAQESAKIFPSTFPQVDTVTDAYEEMTGKEVGGEAGTGSGGTGGTAPGSGGSTTTGAGPLASIIAVLSTDAGGVTIDEIEAMLTKSDPATAEATLAAIKAALAGVQPNSDERPTAEALLKGEEVPASDAVTVLQEISDQVNEKLGVSSTGDKPGTGASFEDLAPVVAALISSIGSSQQVSWSDIKELIERTDPSGALAEKVEQALQDLPGSSQNADTAAALLKGDLVASTDAGATLQEIINSGR
jgi:hypothetical protein